MRINIRWTGPFSLEETYKLSDSERDYGVYQIYGSHAVYGSSALLYIGKAVQQTFGTRIRQENWEGFDNSAHIQVYVGRIGRTDVSSVAQWNEVIGTAEKMLLYAHSPSANSQNLNFISDTYGDVHVLNWGQYRDLLPEISGARWISIYEDDDLRMDFFPDGYE